MELKDLILCSHVTLSLFAINLSIRLTRLPVYLPCYPFFFTINLFTRLLVHLSTYLVTLSFSQSTCSLVYSFTCPLTMLLCLFRKQLVHLSTRSLVHLLCYSVFFTSNLFTCLLGHSSTYLVTLSPFASNLFTRLLVHLSTNCLFLLNIKVNISIISI